MLKRNKRFALAHFTFFDVPTPGGKGCRLLKSWINLSILLISLPLLFSISLVGWRVDYLQIFDGKGLLIFSYPTANGNKFVTRYIHSVERTPVEDDYRVVGGRIWMWEERVRSSNAGLPSMESPNGRFINSGEWFIYQGGRHSVPEYYYRVGNEYFGLNQADIEPFGRRNFYKIFKGERLRVSVTVNNLGRTKTFISDELANAPVRVPPIYRN